MPRYPGAEPTWPAWHRDKINWLRKRGTGGNRVSSLPSGLLVANGSDTGAAPTWVAGDLAWGGDRIPDPGTWVVQAAVRFGVTSGTADPGRIAVNLTDPTGPTPIIGLNGWLLPNVDASVFIGGFCGLYRSDGTGELGVDGNAYDVGTVTGTIDVDLALARLEDT